MATVKGKGRSRTGGMVNVSGHSGHGLWGRLDILARSGAASSAGAARFMMYLDWVDSNRGENRSPYVCAEGAAVYNLLVQNVPLGAMTIYSYNAVHQGHRPGECGNCAKWLYNNRVTDPTPLVAAPVVVIPTPVVVLPTPPALGTPGYNAAFPPL